LESQLLLEDGKALLGETLYDSAGRIDKTVKSYIETTGGAYFTGDAVAGAANYYDGTNGKPDDNDIPFSRVCYSNDPLNRVLATSPPGVDWENSTLFNWPRSWLYGRQSENGFFDLNVAHDTANLPSDPGETDSKYLLSIARDENGNLVQSIQDGFARTVGTRAYDGASVVTSQAKYNVLGELTEEIPPLGQEYHSTYTYTTRGQVKQKYSPDAGTVTYEYDDAGMLIKVTPEKGVALAQPMYRDYAVDYTYDNFGRITKPSLSNSSLSQVCQEFIYDSPSGIASEIDNSPIDLTNIASALKNTRGRLAAMADYNVRLPQTEGALTRGTAVELFSYNVDGRIENHYRVIPGLPLQTFSYSYDIQGKVTNELYNDGARYTKKTFTYDNLGRLHRLNLLSWEQRLAGISSDGREQPAQYQNGRSPWLEDITRDNGVITMGASTFKKGLFAQPPASTDEWSWVLYDLRGKEPFRITGWGGHQEGSGSVEIAIRACPWETPPTYEQWKENTSNVVTELWYYNNYSAMTNPKEIDIGIPATKWLWVGVHSGSSDVNDMAVFGDFAIHSHETNKDVVDYVYHERGVLDQKVLNPTYISRTYRVHHSYNIQERLTSIIADANGSDFFTEKLFYDNFDGKDPEAPAPLYPAQYNGDISYVEYGFPETSNKYHLSCKYDQLSRLTAVTDKVPGDNEYNEAFSYDMLGRIIQKREGNDGLAGYAPTYMYGNPDGTPTYKNRLQYIANSSSKDKTAGNNPAYLYDPNGNMVLDRSKRMCIEYDWRDLPITFRFFDNIPDIAFSWHNGAKSIDAQVQESGARLLSEVQMLYSAAGERVTKSTYEYEGGAQ
jgi:hypothetical protein